MKQVPSDADQVVFLTRVQKVLDEGQFVAAYKYALIDIVIERSDDSGARLEVKLDWLAEKFIELYWNHSRPFGGAVLSQREGSGWSIDRARCYQRGGPPVRDPWQLRANAYRVLLTRARDATVVFVPSLPELDTTYEYLVGSGFRSLLT